MASSSTHEGSTTPINDHSDSADAYDCRRSRLWLSQISLRCTSIASATFLALQKRQIRYATAGIVGHHQLARARARARAHNVLLHEAALGLEQVVQRVVGARVVEVVLVHALRLLHLAVEVAQLQLHRHVVREVGRRARCAGT